MPDIEVDISDANRGLTIDLGHDEQIQKAIEILNQAK